MADVSNRTLALLLVTSIIVSLGFTMFTLNQISRHTITGLATSQQGRVNLTVESNVAIVLTNSVIDFGSGTVNVTCQTNATLYAGQTYNDTNGRDCWTDQTGAQPVSFNINNDGNRRILLEVKGPEQRAFLNYSGLTYPNNLTWKARNNETGACVGTAGAGLSSSAWQDFGGATKTICTNMSYQPTTNDEIAVDIQLVIPADINPGLRTNTSIEFTGTATN